MATRRPATPTPGRNRALPATGRGETALDRQARKWVRLRIGVLAVAFAAAFLTLAGRAVDLQLVQKARFQEMVADQTLREMVLTPRRGRILDRHGDPLAVSVDVPSVRADPSRIQDLQRTVHALAKVLHLDPGALRDRLEHGRYFAWVKRRVSPEEAQAVKALKLPGIGLTRESQRFYPHRELAAQLLGFAGIDGHGLAGLELELDHALRGTPRSASVLRDAHGNRLLSAGIPDPEALDGGQVTLTLDRTLQYLTEKALGEAYRKAKAKDAMAVVLDPRTGAILAAATRPTFNPNDPGDSDDQERRDRIVTDIYEPGSVFKVFSLSAAMQLGLVTPDTVFDCDEGSTVIGGRVIHDSHEHGKLTVTRILKVSSNIGASKVAALTGKQRLVDFYHRFGFGERTGVKLPGEQPGIVRPASSLSDVGLATISFGQGVSATPLQVATALAAVANGGTLMRPYLVSQVRDDDGKVVSKRGPEAVRQVISRHTAREMTQMMETVVEPGGTAPLAAVPGYVVAGKTGTSQKVDPVTHGYSLEKRVGSFGGFLPADDPRLVILVVIDEPSGVKYGGIVAAPAFREIAENAMRYLGIPPSRPVDDASAPVARAAPPPDDGSDVALPPDLTPPPAGKTLVPDLSGLDLRRAVGLLASRHLEARVDGSGLVAKQTPAAGAIVSPGQSVALTLSPTG